MNEIVPFGKYKGMPIEVLSSDPQYCEWLSGQDWFRERYSKCYNIIINNFTKPEDTPEHNRMQALFLNDDYCEAFIRTLYGEKEESLNIKIKHKCFEINGFDLMIEYYVEDKDNCNKVGFERGGMIFDVFTELKPIIGDDFPTVLRQIKANDVSIKGFSHACALIYDEFSGKGVTENEMIAMFELSKIKAKSLSQIKEIKRRM